MKNYLELNGQKIEITDKQCNEIVKALADISAKESPFKRAVGYYAICSDGTIFSATDWKNETHNNRYESANYCTDKVLLAQRAFYEKVERNLWRFSMENGGSGDWIIYYNTGLCHWEYRAVENKYFGPSFKTAKIAERAFKEVLAPLIEKESKYQVCDLFEWNV